MIQKKYSIYSVDINAEDHKREGRIAWTHESYSYQENKLLAYPCFEYEYKQQRNNRLFF